MTSSTSRTSGTSVSAQSSRAVSASGAAATTIAAPQTSAAAQSATQTTSQTSPAGISAVDRAPVPGGSRPEFAAGGALPEKAATRVEFISAINLRETTELNPVPGSGIDVPFFRRYARAVEDAGFDYTLVPYGSNSADSFTISAALSQITDRLKPIIAVRPNTVHPLVAAQQLASVDQLSGGRATLHVISGGNDVEQARHGDYTTKDERYERSAEWIEILRRAWTEKQPFSHEGKFYKFDDFGPGFPTVNGTIPISVGGSSEAAYRVGGALGDIFGLWGEPLAETQEQIDKIAAGARAAGRTDTPRTWVTFRPILAQTDAQAWEKAYRYIGTVEKTFQSGAYHKPYTTVQDGPQNVGSQRLLDIAAKGDVHDRALWTKPAAVTQAAGASTALVGSPETVAAAILDYIDLGADLVSIRGYDNLNDVIDYGRYVLPLVRQELAHRAATGTRGSIQEQNPGAFAVTADGAR